MDTPPLPQLEVCPLTPEQEFQLANWEKLSAPKLTREQLIEATMMLYRHIYQQKNSCKALLQKEWGL